MTEEDYRSFALTDAEGYLTNAGALLADQNIYRHSRIFCTRWNGLDKTSSLGEALDDKELSGGLVNQLYAAMDFVRANTKRKWRKSGLTRIENPEYDEDAVREAIVNGIIHREYTRLGAEVCLDIYDNRIEITSPGSMFSGKHIDKTVDEIVASERRNPVIADVFARMKFMERRGSGLKKITDKTNSLFDDGNNHVEYYSDNNYFKVTIYNANYGQEEKDGDVPVNVPVNNTEKQIIEAMLQNPQITYDELATIVQKTRKTVMRNISNLKKKKLIERIGSDKSGSWNVLK